jgi:hypothetical protein
MLVFYAYNEFYHASIFSTKRKHAQHTYMCTYGFYSNDLAGHDLQEGMTA